MSRNSQLGAIFELQARRQGSYLVVFAVIMAIVALGVVIGFSYLLPTENSTQTLYLATGGPTIVLVMTALVTVPMQNAGAKLAGYIDFVKALPTSRTNFLVADVTIWALVTVPGIIISMLVAQVMYHPGYDVSWNVIWVFPLVVAASFGIGYGYSFVLPAEMSMAISQIVAFVALMFSPINFPIDRLPGWWQAVQRVLPLYPMADVMRATLAQSTFTADRSSYVILLVWAVLGFFGATRFLDKA